MKRYVTTYIIQETLHAPTDLIVPPISSVLSLHASYILVLALNGHYGRFDQLAGGKGAFSGNWVGAREPLAIPSRNVPYA